ncbi:MAG: hypothetical protein KIG14_01305 [Candidatus Sacchiramonaceae bacterium]|nr:hypothetical protein [Candidatus Saccharimonadaceae bacterium]
MGDTISIARYERIKYQKAIIEISKVLDKTAFYKIALAMNLNVFEVKNSNVVKEINFENFSEAEHSRLIVKVDAESKVGVNLHTGEIVQFNSELDAISFKDIIDTEDKKYLDKFKQFLDIIAGDEIPVIAEYISELFVADKIEITLTQEKL